jgi:virginiamycin B lyase
MMGRFFSILTSLRRRTRQTPRRPKRSRSWTLEDLEGRRLLSNAIQPFVTLQSPDLPTSNVISGPGGDLWVGVSPTSNSAAIDRVGLNGSVTSFPLPGTAAAGFSINSLTDGPDGNMWFVADFNPSSSDNQVMIGSVTPAGQVTEFPPIPVTAGLAAAAHGIVSGPGGDLWFGYTVIGSGSTPGSQNFIGRVTTDGSVTLFPISSFGSNSSEIVYPPVSGADGNLWFTEGLGNDFVLGRMTPNGAVTDLPVRSTDWGEVGNGPNGNLIVTMLSANWRNEVFQVTTAGALMRYNIPAAVSEAFAHYVGAADGSLWFTDGFGSPKIGLITARGVIRSYKLFRVVHGINDLGSMALGTDGNLYLLDDVVRGAIDIPTLYRLTPSELAPPRHTLGQQS